jgi:hypothetical protein
MRMRGGVQGPSLQTKQPTLWQHPWTLSATWSAAANAWYATLKPGLVGCVAPIYRTTVAAQALVGLSLALNPLTQQPFTSAAGAPNIDVPIYLAPAIDLTWTALGFDGDPTRAVPQFFLDRGVQIAPPDNEEDELLSGNDAPTPPPTPPGLRLLRSCDVYLHQPRSGLTSTTTDNPSGAVTGAPTSIQTLSEAPPAPTDALQVLSGTYVPFNPASGIDPTSSDYTEPTYDEILIGTIFMLSPPNSELNSEPDNTWQPFVRHNLFWNLTYYTPPFRLPPAPSSIDLNVPLAGGAAQGIIGGEESQVNTSEQNDANALAAYSLQGTFYTPTGAGSTSAFAAAPAPAPTGATGFDKAGIITAQAVAAGLAIANETLDPPFPYFTQPFPPSLLPQ